MNENEELMEVYTSDDKWISLRIHWIPDETYWISIGRKCEIIDELLVHGIECKFAEFSALNQSLIFVDNYGVKHELDPVIDSCAENVHVYRMIGEIPNAIVDEEKWFDIKSIPFDRSFFKLGHPYMVKERRGAEPIPVMLIGMNFDQLHFIHVPHPDNPKDPGIAHIYITAERYKNMKKPYWFYSLMTEDVWSKPEEENKE